MNRTTALIIAAVVLILAIYAAVQYSGRMTTQPTESPTPPASTSPTTPPAPGSSATTPPAAPSPATPESTPPAPAPGGSPATPNTP